MKRSAIVTGAASGIGRALAEELAHKGVHVVLADRQVDLAQSVAAGIREVGGSARAVELDVRAAQRFCAVAREAADESGRLDFLFNNAGIGVFGPARDYEPADWDDVFDVNLRGVAHGIAAAYPLMAQQGFGHIVNTASMAGLIAAPMMASYTATKHAVVGLSRVLRVEGLRDGVKVSVVCPGIVNTPLIEGGRYGRINTGAANLARLAKRYRGLALDPPVFARRVLRGVERNRAVIIVPGWARLFWYVDRAAPWLSNKLVEALYRSMNEPV
jgi:NAD(P)-dependent dehydrogenase (short-subunit alcohol dehydrogenase family)